MTSERLLGMLGVVVVVLASLSLSVAHAYLGFTQPVKNATAPVGKPLNVTGWSSPSNSTRTDCTVMLNTNAQGYKPVIPLGVNGTYVNWSALTTVKHGLNTIEARLQCHDAINGTVNFVAYQSRNVTAP